MKKAAYILLTIAMLCSCGEDRTYEYLELTQENQWIYDTMKEAYLWNDSVKKPARKNFFAVSEKFFSNLLFRSDNFSFFTDSASTTSYGMGYAIMRDPTGTQRSKNYALVLSVEPGSPAHMASIKRGDWISKIGSNSITTSTTVLDRGAATTIYTQKIELDEESMTYSWTSGDTIKMEAAREATPAAIYLDTIYTQRNRKIGYIVYNRFTPNSNEAFKEKLSHFKAEQVNDLIIDLRYNSGGSIATAGTIAGMLLPTDVKNAPYCNLQYNSYNCDKDTAYMLDGTDIFTPEKLYIVCSNSTRGAAETFIHALRTTLGYNNAIVIGEQTYGEYVMTEKIESKYNFAINPAVAYIGDDEGTMYLKYGITPNYQMDELTNYHSIYALGNRQEYMLYNILYHIANGSMPHDQPQQASATEIRMASNAKGIMR